MKTILTNCTVIDCTGKLPMEDMTVIIEGDKIAELKPGVYQQAAGEGERVFDLKGGYVLPGLWNVHVHLGDLLPDPKYLMDSESAIDYAIRAGRNAMDALRAGVTGNRVVGEDAFVDVAWKWAFDAGVFVGPRLFVCGKAILVTGGHGHGTLGAVEVDGPYEMRKAVREQLKHGADQIKLVVTGGVMTAGHLVKAGMTEMEALVAATRTSADLCGVVDRLGTVEVGKLADFIAVSANPLENISNIRRLKLVFKGGSLVDTSPQEGLADFRELFF